MKCSESIDRPVATILVLYYDSWRVIVLADYKIWVNLAFVRLKDSRKRAIYDIYEIVEINVITKLDDIDKIIEIV
jgi:hypothetical protein